MRIRRITDIGFGGALCLLGLGLAPATALAAPCMASMVGDLIGSSCTIGDLTFNFTGTGDNGGVNGISADQFTFMPNAGNPLSPSFSITAPTILDSLTVSAPNASGSYYLSFTATVTSGSALLSGLDVTIEGAVSGGTATSGAGGGTLIDAANESTLAMTPAAYPEACIQSGGGFSACLPTEGPGSASAIGTFTGGPVVMEDGMADWLIATDETGTATFSIASYSFDLQPQVPEPMTMALMGGALIGLGISRRRFH